MTFLSPFVIEENKGKKDGSFSQLFHTLANLIFLIKPIHVQSITSQDFVCICREFVVDLVVECCKRYKEVDFASYY